MAAISMENVWKVFGDRSKEAMEAIAVDRLDKAEVQKRFECIVGVADATLSVEPGEILCVMGLSGSGKSTLIRHINRLLEPSAGRILIHGEDILKKSPSELRALRSRGIGMVFQAFGLLPHRTVRDNVALPLEIQGLTRRERFEKAEAALHKVNLSGWGDRYCHELSGGMQQRVGLARAIAGDMSILLMDEPFSALDPLIRRQLQEEFLFLSKSMGKTVIFVTHDLDEAIRIGDRIAVMKDGVILQTGTPSDIVLNPRHEYVARFVAEVPIMNVVTAGEIMVAIDRYPEHLSLTLERLDHADPRDKLSQLIAKAAASPEPIIVRSEERAIGVIDRSTLLRGMTGTTAI